MTKIFSVRNTLQQLLILALRKKLLHFFENSDYFEPSLIMELMPPDYLHKERVILLAKSKKYKDVIFNNELLILMCRHLKYV